MGLGAPPQSSACVIHWVALFQPPHPTTTTATTHTRLSVTPRLCPVWLWRSVGVEVTAPFKRKKRGRVKSLLHCSLLIPLVPPRRIYFFCQLVKGFLCPSEKLAVAFLRRCGCYSRGVMRGYSIRDPTENGERVRGADDCQKVRIRSPGQSQDRKIPEGTNGNYSSKNNTKWQKGEIEK